VIARCSATERRQLVTRYTVRCDNIHRPKWTEGALSAILAAGITSCVSIRLCYEERVDGSVPRLAPQRQPGSTDQHVHICSGDYHLELLTHRALIFLLAKSQPATPRCRPSVADIDILNFYGNANPSSHESLQATTVREDDHSLSWFCDSTKVNSKGANV